MNEQTVDLLISHSQILVRSRAYDEASSQWGQINIAQGAILHPDYLIFDPLPTDAFGAQVHLELAQEFTMDADCQRGIVAPFTITDRSKLEIASASEKFPITLPLDEQNYAVYYEICEGDEVFYQFTFVPAQDSIEAHYLMDDPWGGAQNATLKTGNC